MVRVLGMRDSGEIRGADRGRHQIEAHVQDVEWRRRRRAFRPPIVGATCLGLLVAGSMVTPGRATGEVEAVVCDDVTLTVTFDPRRNDAPPLPSTSTSVDLDGTGSCTVYPGETPATGTFSATGPTVGVLGAHPLSCQAGVAAISGYVDTTASGFASVPGSFYIVMDRDNVAIAFASSDVLFQRAGAGAGAFTQTTSCPDADAVEVATWEGSFAFVVKGEDLEP
jgi:hypothetical protein